jgi:ferric-dicitrate binding protein FerR (iron transport regulator)
MLYRYETYSADEFLQDESFLKWMAGNEMSKAFWINWIRQHPERLGVLEEAIQLYGLLRSQGDELPAIEDEEQVLQNILSAIPENKGRRGKRRVKSFFRPVLSLVVILFLIGFVGIYFLKADQPPAFKNVLLSATDTVKQYLLPDSTVLTLNKNSECRFRASFENNREVWINGEAFLDVSHQVDKAGHHKSFVVHLNNAALEVLGTRFSVVNIKNRRMVMLEKGSVKLSNSYRELILQPGQMGHVEESTIELQNIDPMLYTSWITGNLDLHETRLSEIIDMLRYRYGYEVINKANSKKLEQKVSGSVNVQDIHNLLNTLSLAFDVSFELRHNVVIISYQNNQKTQL